VLLHAGADYHSWKGLIERGHAESEGPVEPAETAGALKRLGEMANYATRLTCRHRQLVEHFGQAYQAPGDGEHGCGACDVCLREIEEVPDGHTLARKVLSAVARCEERFGAAHVANVLRGADTDAIRRAGHDRLSTHGLLRDRSQSEIRAWIDQLIGAGHLVVVGDRYPTLALSPSGREVMRDARQATLFAWPAPEGKRPRRERGAASVAVAGVAVEEVAPIDAVLFDRLRALRRVIARERGVPPYVVFHDRTLVDMAACRPASPDAFRAVKGVGDKKAADHGPRFLACIAEFVTAAE
jgi:ATP-dependent DNA helicase RecQ